MDGRQQNALSKQVSFQKCSPDMGTFCLRKVCKWSFALSSFFLCDSSYRFQKDKSRSFCFVEVDGIGTTTKTVLSKNKSNLVNVAKFSSTRPSLNKSLLKVRSLGLINRKNCCSFCLRPKPNENFGFIFATKTPITSPFGSFWTKAVDVSQKAN